MTPMPIYKFNNTSSVGIDSVPINGKILIVDSDGSGTPKEIILKDKTGITGSTTITQLLALTSQYNNVGVSGVVEELISETFLDGANVALVEISVPAGYDDLIIAFDDVHWALTNAFQMGYLYFSYDNGASYTLTKITHTYCLVGGTTWTGSTDASGLTLFGTDETDGYGWNGRLTITNYSKNNIRSIQGLISSSRGIDVEGGYFYIGTIKKTTAINKVKIQTVENLNGGYIRLYGVKRT